MRWTARHVHAACSLVLSIQMSSHSSMYTGKLIVRATWLQLKGELDQGVKFDPLKYKTPALPPSPEHQTRHRAAAQEFDDMWRTGDPAAAQQILAEDVSIVSLQEACQNLCRICILLVCAQVAGTVMRRVQHRHMAP